MGLRIYNTDFTAVQSDRLMFSIPHLNTLRKAEINRIVTLFEPHARILEIGAS